MNKKELVKSVSEHVEMSIKDTTEVVDAIFNTITAEMASGEEVSITGFGKFCAVEKAERVTKIPNTGETVVVPAHKAPKFKPSSALKEAVA